MGPDKVLKNPIIQEQVRNTKRSELLTLLSINYWGHHQKVIIIAPEITPRSPQPTQKGYACASNRKPMGTNPKSSTLTQPRLDKR